MIMHPCACFTPAAGCQAKEGNSAQQVSCEPADRWRFQPEEQLGYMQRPCDQMELMRGNFAKMNRLRRLDGKAVEAKGKKSLRDFPLARRIGEPCACKRKSLRRVAACGSKPLLRPADAGSLPAAVGANEKKPPEA
ncbi:MAG: hypothetical protein ACXWU7_09225, partial [Telluria sp.]